MPTKNENIELGVGTLYIKHPGTGEPVPCGLLKGLEITETRTEYVDELGIVNPCIATPPPEWSVTIETAPDTIFMQVLRLTEEIRSCARWARNERPRLVHMSLHARKRRTRKKNLVRLVREYIREGRVCR